MSRTPPRGWSTRQADSASLDMYQVVCGHYIPRGTYFCRDCNLAPLTDHQALVDMLRETVDRLEGETILTKQDVLTITKAKALLAEVTG